MALRQRGRAHAGQEGLRNHPKSERCIVGAPTLAHDLHQLRKRKQTLTFRRGVELTRFAILGSGMDGGVGER